MKTTSKAKEGALIEELVAALGDRFGHAPEVGVVLGSGWSEGAGTLLGDADEIPLGVEGCGRCQRGCEANASSSRPGS